MNIFSNLRSLCNRTFTAVTRVQIPSGTPTKQTTFTKSLVWGKQPGTQMGTLGQIFCSLVLFLRASEWRQTFAQARKMPLSAIALAAVVLALPSCGGSALNPINPPAVEASAPGFPPAQPLTCSGDYLSPAGMICDESDGKAFYNHSHWSVAIRPDGHGTFQASTEQGIRKGGLYQISFPLPQFENIVEIHPTLSVNSYCSGNGFESKWDGNGNNTVEHLIGSKAARFDASGISQDFPVSQIIYPQPVPVSALYLYTFADLCATSTVHWTVTGSF